MKPWQSLMLEAVLAGAFGWALLMLALALLWKAWRSR